MMQVQVDQIIAVEVGEVVEFWIGIALRVKLPGFADNPKVRYGKEGSRMTLTRRAK